MSYIFLLKIGHVSQYTVATLDTDSVLCPHFACLSVSDMVNSVKPIFPQGAVSTSILRTLLCLCLSLTSQKSLVCQHGFTAARIPQKLWKPQSQQGLTLYYWICVGLEAALTVQALPHVQLRTTAQKFPLWLLLEVHGLKHMCSPMGNQE